MGEVDDNNPQYTRMIPIPVNKKYVTLEEELKKQPEYYQLTIKKEESPAQKKREERQKEREERRNKILEEYLMINASKKNIDNKIYSKSKEYISLQDEQKKNELEILESTRNDISNKMRDIVNQLVLLKEEEAAEEEAVEEEAAEEEAVEEEAAEEYPRGGKRNTKGKSKKVAKKPVVSQKKQSIYKEIFGKQMKIYKMPDSRKEYVKYKGELLHISDYKDLMKQKAIAKTKTKVTKTTQQKAKSKTKK